MATRDFVRSELRDLLEELEERCAAPAPGPDDGATPRRRRDRRRRTGAQAARGREPARGCIAMGSMFALRTAHRDALLAALATVNDPEIRRPITELGMVKRVDDRRRHGRASTMFLTVAGCPMKETLTTRRHGRRRRVPGVDAVDVELDVMSDEQRPRCASSCAAAPAEPEIPFAKPGSLTRVYAVASGKGGVGKSSVTVNLAAAMAAEGLRGRRAWTPTSTASRCRACSASSSARPRSTT